MFFTLVLPLSFSLSQQCCDIRYYRYEPRVETRDSFSNLKYVLVCKQSVFQLFPLILHILWDFYAQYDLPLSDLYNLIPPVVRSSTMGRHMMSALCTICTSSLSAWVIKIDFVRTGIRSFVYANEWMRHLVLRFSFCFKKQRRYMVTCHERIKWRIPEKISQHPVQMGRSNCGKWRR